MLTDRIGFGDIIDIRACISTRIRNLRDAQGERGHWFDAEIRRLIELDERLALKGLAQ